MRRKKNRIIQVPMPEDLVASLDKIAYELGEPRAYVIREAAARYVTDTEEAEKVRQYIEGYEKYPEDEEDLAWAEYGARLLAEKYAEDEW
jgi:metal-responsive CopG/Arc/MetJ family transcriptional regulator